MLAIRQPPPRAAATSDLGNARYDQKLMFLYGKHYLAFAALERVCDGEDADSQFPMPGKSNYTDASTAAGRRLARADQQVKLCRQEYGRALAAIVTLLEPIPEDARDPFNADYLVVKARADEMARRVVASMREVKDATTVVFFDGFSWTAICGTCGVCVRECIVSLAHCARVRGQRRPCSSVCQRPCLDSLCS